VGGVVVVRVLLLAVRLGGASVASAGHPKMIIAEIMTAYGCVRPIVRAHAATPDSADPT